MKRQRANTNNSNSNVPSPAKKVRGKPRGDSRFDAPTALYSTLRYEPKPPSDVTVSATYGASARAIFNAHKHKPRIYNFVIAHFIIPNDFDIQNRYGSRSGTCHEERVINAYANNLLTPKDTKTMVPRCWQCGAKGHFPRYCTDLFTNNKQPTPNEQQEQEVIIL